ncbi:amidohydrolase 2 [Catenovulum agarivorans DS-2]|uniref:Amidohydrolase 2 n=1 Tax=Catenovulum agarivorans DS-2 TaxID=1328313 RepID=W7QU39_9ALTE|nr:amidohydrolase family protein [Catenovulum agarivorans]EWH08965.1 amidohydrolase 2 [Catenovulum agarivorans DS-2]
MKIDSHQHFWRYNQADYGWIGEQEQVLKRDFLPSDLAPILSSNQLDACVAVQARQSDSETQWLIELANDNSFIKAVVGWIDIAADTLSEQLAQYASHPVLKGFRHVIQDEPDANFMLRPEFIRGLKVLAKHDYCYDLLIFAKQLPQAIELVKSIPELPIVVDHIAKPEIAADIGFAQWQTYMQQIADCPNTMCKVSGMVTEADHQNWQAEDFQKYLAAVFDAFGPQRIMFGSDWPVCLLAAEYSQVKAIVEDFVKTNYPQQFAAIFGGNAQTFYRI